MLPRDRAGNRGFGGRRSSDTACEDDGTDKASSRLRADSLKEKKNYNITKCITIEIIMYSV